MDDERIGTTLQNRYRIDRLLGEGGMGAVYEGEHLLIGRRVAIKFLHRELATDAAAVARFLREAKAATSIQHKHIVEVTDMGQADDGALYMVLEYLEGRDWAEDLESAGPQSVSKVVHIALQVCDALTAAHESNVVHRDLKPENIFLVERDGDDSFVKVVDFGISKLVGDDNNMTKTGMVLGTPYFMSPEQARDSKTVDRRADLYSLGVVLFHALTHRFPFEADTYGSLVVQICTEDPPSAKDLRADVPDDLAHIIDTLLAKDPVERFQTAAALKTALAPFAKGADRKEALGLAVTEMAPAAAPNAPTPNAPAPNAPAPNAPTSALDTPRVHESPLNDAQPVAKSTLEPAPKAAPGGGQVVALVAVMALGITGGVAVFATGSDSVSQGTDEPTTPEVPTAPQHLPAPSEEAEAQQPGSPPPSMAAQEEGTLSVNSMPHSMVTIDGVERDHTPLRILLPPGEHRVELRAPDGTIHRSRVTVHSGEVARVLHRFDRPSEEAARGQLAPGDLRDGIRGVRREIQRCYERADRAGSSRIVFNITVEPDGSVGNVTVQTSTLHDSDAEACMMQAIRRLSFPSAERSTTAAIPFNFTSQ